MLDAESVKDKFKSAAGECKDVATNRQERHKVWINTLA